MAVGQVVLKDGIIKNAWNDPRCKEHFRTFPDDPLHIPFDDPSPQVQWFWLSSSQVFAIRLLINCMADHHPSF